MSRVTDVRLLSNYGAALLLVASNDRIRIRDVATSLGISERAAQTIVADLVRGGYVRRRSEGRGYVYEVNESRPMNLPLPNDSDVRSLLGALVAPSDSVATTSFDEVFADSGIPTAAIDLTGVIVRANPALADLFAEPVERFIGLRWDQFIHQEDRERWREVAAKIVEGTEFSLGEGRFVRSDGSSVWAAMYVTNVRDDDGESLYYLVHLPDISDRKRLEEQLDFYDYYDALTGLANRTLLRNRLALALGELHRHGSHFGLVAVQLEHFKLIYSTLGHERGDELIRQVAIRLATCIGPNDFAARVGDNEFVVVCESGSDGETSLARCILDSLRAPFEGVVKHHLMTVSLGVVVAGHDSTVDQLLRDVSAAATRAREDGGNRVAFFDSLLCQEAQRRSQLMVGLLHALEREQLTLHYQPIVDLATGELACVEALLRWNHPELGAVSPAEFIPLVEELDLIGEVGGWVVEQACQQLSRWAKQGHDFSLAVNISVQQMMTTDLVELIKHAVAGGGFDARRLILELTESILMVDHSSFRRISSDLKSLGVRLSVDDFGTGYSSLARLKDMPVDELKIDQSFVQGIGVDETDTSLVEAMISMARAIGLSVTAEGIENSTQLGCLRRLGCEHGQGFYLARPMAARGIDELLRQRPRWPLA